MKQPTVTIAVPVYNGAAYLRESLDSILSQDFGDFEVIIGDNASSDGTEDICRDFAARDPRIVYHRSPLNRGAAWNYNRLFGVAAGRYFKWASHDDRIAPGYLTACVGELERCPEAVIAFPHTVLIARDGQPLGGHADDWDVRYGRAWQRFRHTINQHGLHNVVFGLMRAEAVRSTRLIGRFDGSDIVFLTEMALRGQFHQVPGDLFQRRIHEGMSRRALKNPRDVAKWFDTSARAYHFTWTRLYAETVRAVVDAPLSPREKALCLAITTRDWQWKRLGTEWLQTVQEITTPSAPDRYENFSEQVEHEHAAAL